MEKKENQDSGTDRFRKKNTMMGTVCKAVDIFGLTLTSVSLVVTVLITIIVGGVGIGPVRGNVEEISEMYHTQVRKHANLSYCLKGWPRGWPGVYYCELAQPLGTINDTHE